METAQFLIDNRDIIELADKIISDCINPTFLEKLQYNTYIIFS